jgi:serine phosphatase RsbU (regulator of sigma subunit)
MKSMKRLAFYCIVSSALALSAFSQKTSLDSLWDGINVHDTVKIRDILNYGILVQKQSLDSALLYYQWAIDFANEIISNSPTNQQTVRSAALTKATSLRCIGIVNYYQGKYDKALECYLESLKITEEFDDKNGIASCYNNIGMIHSFQGSYTQAIYYYNKALEIKKVLGDKNGVSACYSNIGIVHYSLGNESRTKGDETHARENYSNAIEFYSKSLKLYEELDDKKWMSACYNNIGLVYKALGKYYESIDCNKKSLKLKNELNDKHGMLSSLINISNLNIVLADSTVNDQNEKMKLLNKAVEYGIQAIELSRELKIIPRESEAAFSLMKAYRKLGNSKKAYQFAEIYISTKDSIFSNEKTKAIAEMQAKYETEKKQQEIEKQQLVIDKQRLDNARQRNQRNFFIVGSVLLALLAMVFINNYNQKTRSNTIITEKNSQLEQAYEEIKATLEALGKQNETLNAQFEEITKQSNEIEMQRNSLANLAWELQEKGEEIETQKNILAIQNKEITDSIIYAQRIQSAVLPSGEILDQLFSDHFIIYKPKSIVSGDFYWTTKIRELIIFCVTDCTGHGVPGAFMSMMGVSFLNEIVRKEEVTNPAQVLDQLREHVVSSMIESGGNYVQLDGMDIGLCVLNTQTLKLQFAGANIPCWIATSSSPQNYDNERVVLVNGLIELKPDRMPIGRFERMENFSYIEHQLHKNEYIYIATDGFSDQFGEANGKKFQKHRLIELIANGNHLPLADQKALLEKTFDEWKGNRSQIDDVTILGVKV